jgi:AraC-like DNA-binding protein
VSTRHKKDTVIGVRFKPYGLYTGFGIDGNIVSNAIVPGTLLIEDSSSLFTGYNAGEDKLQLIQELNDTLYSILRPKKLLLEIQEMIGALVTCDLTNDSQKYLAALFERSPKSFIATFKKATGFTPIKYLHIQKIEQAKNLMVNNNELPLAEIGYILGFYDQSHFIRTFRQHTGSTPNQFKKNLLQF